jgi:O-antigen/teichoic acid export membrane protein
VHADGPHGYTTHGQIHQAVGIATFVLLISAMFVLVRPFRRDRRFRGLATPTLLWAFAAVGGFFLIPPSGAAYFGLAQRIFLAIILSWALTVATHGLDRATALLEATVPGDRRAVPTSTTSSPKAPGLFR